MNLPPKRPNHKCRHGLRISICFSPKITFSAQRENWIPSTSTYSFQTRQNANSSTNQTAYIMDAITLHCKESQSNSHSSSRTSRARDDKCGNTSTTAHCRKVRINVPWRRYNGNDMLPRKTKGRRERKYRSAGEFKIEMMRKIAPDTTIVRWTSAIKISSPVSTLGVLASCCREMIEKERVDDPRICHKSSVYRRIRSEEKSEHCQGDRPVLEKPSSAIVEMGVICGRVRFRVVGTQD